MYIPNWDQTRWQCRIWLQFIKQMSSPRSIWCCILHIFVLLLHCFTRPQLKQWGQCPGVTEPQAGMRFIEKVHMPDKLFQAQLKVLSAPSSMVMVTDTHQGFLKHKCTNNKAMHWSRDGQGLNLMFPSGKWGWRFASCSDFIEGNYHKDWKINSCEKGLGTLPNELTFEPQPADYKVTCTI